MQRAQPRRFNRVVASGSSAANGVTRRDPRGDEPLPLQPIERGVNGAGRHVPLKPVLDLFQDGAAIPFAPQQCVRLRQGEQDGLFEESKAFCQIYLHCR